jgi:hypothetical protein
MPVELKHPKTKALGLALTLALGVPAAAQAMTSGTEGERAGYLWLDLVVAVGFLAGIVLLGLWGDLALGVVIGGIWTLVELCVRLGATGLRATRVFPALGTTDPRKATRKRGAAATTIGGEKGLAVVAVAVVLGLTAVLDRGAAVASAKREVGTISRTAIGRSADDARYARVLPRLPRAEAARRLGQHQRHQPLPERHRETPASLPTAAWKHAIGT